MELFPDFDFQPRLSTPQGVPSEVSEPATKVVRPVTEATLGRLVAQANQFRTLEAWNRIRENEMIGLRDPETNELGIVSVLGRGCQIFALHYHFPPEGIEFWQRALSGQPPEKGRLHMLQCEFLNKDDVSDEDAELIAPFGRISRKRKGVPKFRSFRGEVVDQPLAQDEAEILSLVFDLFFLYFSQAFPRKHKQFYQWSQSPEQPHLIPTISLKAGGSANYLSDWQVESQPLVLDKRSDFTCNQAA